MGALAMLVYALTAFRTVGGGDSGELIVAAHTLGVVHPPGYPLYTLLAKLFSTSLAIGPVAWRVNLFSAACDAVAAGFCVAAAARLSREVWSGVLGAGLFAFSPLVWTYATTAEVFGLNNLFVAAAVWIAASYLDTRDSRLLRVGAFLFGLAMSHHQTFVFVGAPLAFWALWIGGLQVRRDLIPCAALFVLGLAPYLYLPLVAGRHSLAMWGDTGTLSGWISHVLRSDYGLLRLARPETAAGEEGAFLRRVALFFNEIWKQGFWFAMPMTAVVGAAAAIGAKRTRSLTLVLVGSLVAYVIAFATLANLRVSLPLHVGILARFWQQPELLLCIFAGVGAAWIWRSIERRAIVATATIAVVAIQVGTHWRSQDEHANRAFESFARAIVNRLPNGTILLSQGDHVLNTVRYLQAVEDVRPDVRHLDEMIMTYTWARPYYGRLFPGVVLPKDAVYNAQGFDMKDFLDANIARSPIYICNGVLQGDTRFTTTYRLWAIGLCERAEPRSAKPELRALVEENHAAFASVDERAVAGAAPETWEAALGEHYRMMHYRFVDELLAYVTGELPASAPQEVPSALRLVIAEQETLGATLHDPNPLLFKNLGIAYQKLAETDSGARQGMIRAWKRYLASAPAVDSDVSSIRALVEQAERGQ